MGIRQYSEINTYFMAIFLGNLWETPGDKGVEKIVDRPPDCFYDLVKSPGITTMHVYLKDYKTLCIFDQKMIDLVYRPVKSKS